MSGSAAFQREANLRHLKELELASVKRHAATVASYSALELQHREALDERMKIEAEIDELKVPL